MALISQDERLEEVLGRLDHMHREGIWPNGLRYLWTDAFGVILLLSLRDALNDDEYLERAEELVHEVERVLGRDKGIRIGETPDRDGQYFHYLAMWLFALYRLGQIKPKYHERAVELVHDIHPHFVIPEVGVIWKMEEDLSGPYPGYGLGGLDPFHGYVVYSLLDEQKLADEIVQMRRLLEKHYHRLHATQDLGLGMLLWLSHFFSHEHWATTLRERSLSMLERMWIDPPGYFCREPGSPQVRFAFTNYGVSVGLQAVNAYPERVDKIHSSFATYRSGDHYDTDAITHVMGCCSLLPGLLLGNTIRSHSAS